MRPTLTPANIADDLLFKALAHDDSEALAALRSHMPGAIVDGIARVVEGRIEPDNVRHLAQVLRGAGMVAAAGAALRRYANALPNPPERAAAYFELAALERTQGLTAAAEAHTRIARRLAGEDQGEERVPELSAAGLVIQCAFADPHRHAARLAALPAPPLAEDPLRDPGFTKRLWHFSGDGSGGVAEDYSFFVLDPSGQPLLLVECDVRGDSFLACRETGIALTEIAPGSDQLEVARELALRQLETITIWAGCPYFWLDVPGDGRPSAAVARRGAALPETHVIAFRNGWIDLRQDEATIQRLYRQTTRHAIRWGRENMTVASYGDEGADIVAAYADMHIRIGRTPALTPDILAAALADGQFHAYMGFHQDELVGMVLTSRHGLTTYDMSTMRISGSRQPLSHILVHRAIMGAKERGQHRFHFGPLWDSGQFGAKLKNIALFKGGFASAFEPRLMLRLGD